MKISTWNVNSIKTRLPHVLQWLKEDKPDVVLLQELKCLTEAFPYEEIEELGYNIEVLGQKTYNGVAILSKYPLSDVVTTFSNNPIASEARYIEAIINYSKKIIRVASVYVPNGQDLDSEKYKIKLEFLENLGMHINSFAEEKFIIGGDFNIALAEQDVYDPMQLEDSILFSFKERKQLREFLANGMIDTYRINKNDEGYTWWDYRANSFARNLGMRIDYIFSNPEAVEDLVSCYVSKELRGKEKASDHAPVTAVFSF